MGRRLNTHVLVDGTVYPPGTDEGDIKGRVTADVWDEVDKSDDESAKPSARRGRKPASKDD